MYSTCPGQVVPGNKAVYFVLAVRRAQIFNYIYFVNPYFRVLLYLGQIVTSYTNQQREEKGRTGIPRGLT